MDDRLHFPLRTLVRPRTFIDPELAGRWPRLALAISLLALAGCSKTGAPAADKSTPVNVAVATAGPATPPITTTGIVAGKAEMRLSFKLGGVIRKIAVVEGEEVKQGQRLAEIELAEVGAQVEQARQLATKAERDLERGERLHADQVISLEQLQDLRTQSAVAQAALKSAQFNLGFSTIVAPRDGVVLRRNVEEREQVAPGAPVLVLGARDAGYVVKFALADREVVQLRLGDPAEVRMDAFPGQTLAAKVSEISRAADERSRLFPVEVQLETPPPALASGLVAKVTVSPSSARAATLTYVPIAAVVEGQRDQASVFVPSGARAQRRPVRIAFITGEQVALAEGLQPGETVVTQGALYLQGGEPIAVVN
ncbi:MAG: efflux RND transporter periplasmic adaptor subunit [Sinobacteraceae bacterium]|nr:efflux RND transporter periplasmic adaptor subunit [Nevskiaceae bacterium]MCP5338683.1 efflux RND transporter periplasmic adaptor subunit [Nevskiaceae bacterium]MCP5473006.1 efflux RND transporter periplasmic adaptor subunit [Nevskiaceae bacterium]